MLQFYAAQLIMASFAFFIGSKEATVVQMIRKYPYGNPFEKPFHFYGYGAAFIFGSVLALWQADLKGGLITLPLAAFIYWIVFELPMNIRVFGKWNYVGTTAATDKFLWRTFGLQAETWSVILKATGLATANAAYLFL